MNSSNDQTQIESNIIRQSKSYDLVYIFYLCCLIRNFIGISLLSISLCEFEFIDDDDNAMTESNLFFILF